MGRCPPQPEGYQGLEKRDLALRLAERLSDGDPVYVENVREQLDTPLGEQPVALLANDPMVEAAYDELAQEDKQEFKDLASEFKKSKVRRRYNNFCFVGARFASGRGKA